MLLNTYWSIYRLRDSHLLHGRHLRLNSILMGYGAGTLSTNASGVITASSDERLKNISGDYTLGLANILQVNPISYTWKDGTGLADGQSYSGFSAQNLQLAIPEAVTTGPNGYLNIQDRPIIIINAIKELNTLSLAGVTSAQTNAEKIDASDSSLVGTDGVSTSTRALFDKLGLDIADLRTLAESGVEVVMGIFETSMSAISNTVDSLVAKNSNEWEQASSMVSSIS